MSQSHKFGEIHARAMLNLGLVELRNLASFEQSNVQDDIRRSMYDARQEQNNRNEPVRQEQTPELEIQQER